MMMVYDSQGNCVTTRPELLPVYKPKEEFIQDPYFPLACLDLFYCEFGLRPREYVDKMCEWIDESEYHCGDCTKMPIACLRCGVEKELAYARYLYETLWLSYVKKKGQAFSDPMVELATRHVAYHDHRQALSVEDDIDDDNASPYKAIRKHEATWDLYDSLTQEKKDLAKQEALTALSYAKAKAGFSKLN
jgi:hypothetical protein